MFVSLKTTLQRIDLEREAEPLPTPMGDRSVQIAQRGDVIAAAEELVTRGTRATDIPLAPPVEVALRSTPQSKADDEVSLHTRDVNGDGLLDAVVREERTGGAATLLNDGAGKLERTAISLANPNRSDIEHLSKTGAQTGRQFLSVDLNGDGNYQLAVKEGDEWLSLGQTNNPVSAKTAQSEAEQRFKWIVGELSASMPVQAFDQNGRADPQHPGQGRQVGFVQMLNDNTDQDIYSAYNLGASDPGDFVMFDSFGGVVKAFDPFGVGFNLYEGPSAAAAPLQTPPTRPEGTSKP
jgi:hypothetical protein